MNLTLEELLVNLFFNNLLVFKILIFLSFLSLSSEIKKANKTIAVEADKLIVLNWQCLFMFIPIIGELWLVLLAIFSRKKLRKINHYTNEKLKTKVEFGNYGYKLFFVGFSFLAYVAMLLLKLDLLAAKGFILNPTEILYGINFVMFMSVSMLIVTNIINKRELALINKNYSTN